MNDLWTLMPFFQLPIFGIIPNMLAFSGSIGKGKMKHQAYDVFMFFSIFIKYFTSTLALKYVFPNKLFIRMFGTFFAIYIPIFVRIYVYVIHYFFHINK